MPFFSGSTVGTGSGGGEAQMGRDEEQGGAARQKRGAFIRGGNEVWRVGTSEQTGLCSLRTHDYCMRESKVSA